jgi:hypothetical protein
MGEKTKNAVFVICFVIFVIGLLVGAKYTDCNGVRVTTEDAIYSWDKEGCPDSLIIPIKIVGGIEYDGDYIVTKQKFVEFCDVKTAKKEMKEELRGVWKEMRKGSK